MEFELSFKPIHHPEDAYSANQLGGFVSVYTEGRFPDLTEAEVVLVGLPEYRGSSTTGDVDSLQLLRKEFYQLYQGKERLRIADLGDLLQGEQLSDTYQLLADVLAECERRGLFALIIGGGQAATFGQYKACVQSGRMVNLVTIDARFDLGLSTDLLDSQSYLSPHVLPCAVHKSSL